MVICCLGDSLTEGDYGISGQRGIGNVHPENYPFFLAENTGCEVRNFGKCGYTSGNYWDLYRTGIWDVHDADVIIIMLGTNGGLYPDRKTGDSWAYEEMVEQLKKDAPKAKIVLVTPPHCTADPNYSNCGYSVRVEPAAAYVRKLAETAGVNLFDLASVSVFSAETEAIFQGNDGLHFNELGYRVLAALMERYLRQNGMI